MKRQTHKTIATLSTFLVCSCIALCNVTYAADGMWDVLRSTLESHPSLAPDISSLGNLVGMVLNIAMGSATAIAIVGVILAGIKYITGKGDYKAMAKAKDALSYAILAMVLAAAAFSVKLIILNLFGATGEVINEVPNI